MSIQKMVNDLKSLYGDARKKYEQIYKIDILRN